MSASRSSRSPALSGTAAQPRRRRSEPAADWVQVAARTSGWGDVSFSALRRFADLVSLAWSLACRCRARCRCRFRFFPPCWAPSSVAMFAIPRSTPRKAPGSAMAVSGMSQPNSASSRRHRPCPPARPLPAETPGLHPSQPAQGRIGALPPQRVHRAGQPAPHARTPMVPSYLAASCGDAPEQISNQHIEQQSTRPRCPVTCRFPVGVAGFEPAASSSRTKRAAKLRHTPPARHRTGAARDLASLAETWTRLGPAVFSAGRG